MMRLIFVVCLPLALLLSSVFAAAHSVTTRENKQYDFPPRWLKKKHKTLVFYSGDPKKMRYPKHAEMPDRAHLKTQWDSLMYGFSCNNYVMALSGRQWLNARGYERFRKDSIINVWARKTFYDGDASLPLRLCSFDGDARPCTWDRLFGDCQPYIPKSYSYHNAALSMVQGYILTGCPDMWAWIPKKDMYPIDFAKLRQWLQAHQTLSRQELCETYQKEIYSLKLVVEP